MPISDLVKLPGWLTFAMLAAFCAAAEKEDDKTSMTIQDTWSLPGIMGGGVKANGVYTDGNLFLTLPAYSSLGRDGWLGGDVLFIEPYSSWGEQGEVAVSLGLGWRHLFSEQRVTALTHPDGHQAGFFEEGVFIGASLFVDLLDTQFDNRFWQLGFGLEAGTRYVELHANYYLPLSDRQLAEEIRTQESFTQQRSTVVTDYGEPFATGHTIQQDLTNTTLTTTTTTTIERLFRRYEDGMEGWDVELALLLPWIDRWMDVKLIGGYYAFDNQPFGPQAGGTGKVQGWKAGLEVRPVPAVVLNATWYEDERLTGDDWIAGIHLELPFEAGDLGDGQGFWDRIGDAFRPRRRHLAERLAEPVKRQNAAVKIASSVEEDQPAAEVTVETRVVSQSRTRVVLANTVVFVDNAIGSVANPGTYEAPLDSIQNGKNAGNATFGNDAIVIVEGRPKVYVESVIITQGVRLYGSGTFPGLGGKVLHGRTELRPHVSGGFVAQSVPATVGIVGFEITEGFAGGVTTGPLSSLSGVGITLQNVARGVIAQNYLHAASTTAANIIVESIGAGNVSEVLVRDNVVNDNGGGVVLRADFLGHMNGRVENNRITGCGLFVATGGASSGTGQFTISGNTITGSPGGLLVGSFLGNGATFAVTSNYLVGNSVGLTVAGTIGGTANVFVSGNTIAFSTFQQIYAQEDVGGTVNFISSGAWSNTVIESPGDPDPLYLPFSGDEGGFILINGIFHPANLVLP